MGNIVMVIVTAVGVEPRQNRTVEVAKELANEMGEELVAMHVMPEETFEAIREETTDRDNGPIGEASLGLAGERRDLPLSGTSGSSTPFNTQDGEHNAARIAQEIVEDTLDGTVDITYQGRIGDPIKEILDEADRRDSRYLVIGGRKRTPVGKAVFGSVTQSILLNSESPIVTVPKDAVPRTESGPVVAAVDRSDRAEKVLEAAVGLTGGLDLDLHIVHVLGQKEFVELERTNVKETGQPLLMDEIRSVAASVAEEAADPIGEEYTSVGLVGEPGERIVEYAEDENASYIVTSGRKRSPVGKVLFGSITQAVLLNADCPVLTVMD